MNCKNVCSPKSYECTEIFQEPRSIQLSTKLCIKSEMQISFLLFLIGLRHIYSLPSQNRLCNIGFARKLCLCKERACMHTCGGMCICIRTHVYNVNVDVYGVLTCVRACACLCVCLHLCVMVEGCLCVYAHMCVWNRQEQRMILWWHCSREKLLFYQPVGNAFKRGKSYFYDVIANFYILSLSPCQGVCVCVCVYLFL